MQTAPPNLLADYLYLRQTAVVKQAIDTARTSVPSGGHSSSYLCQQDSVFAAQDRRLARRTGAGQRPPHQDRDGLGLPLPKRVRTRPFATDRRRALNAGTAV